MVSVLFVDDSKLARIVASNAVAALQPTWKRLEASSASEALSILSKLAVDLAIVDYNMPEKNGLDLAQELRVNRPTMPVAIVTANIQDEIIARARALHATFVSKPITSAGIAAFIASAALRIAKVK